MVRFCLYIKKSNCSLIRENIIELVKPYSSQHILFLQSYVNHSISGCMRTRYIFFCKTHLKAYIVGLNIYNLL